MRLTDLRCPRDGSVPLVARRVRQMGTPQIEVECVYCGHAQVIERKVSTCKFCGSVYTAIFLIEPGTPEYLAMPAKIMGAMACSSECEAALLSGLEAKV